MLRRKRVFTGATSKRAYMKYNSGDELQSTHRRCLTTKELPHEM